MSSEMFPFASCVYYLIRFDIDNNRHKIYGYDLSFADKELKEAGDLAKSYGHRLTMHPGQVCLPFIDSQREANDISSPNLDHLRKRSSKHLSESSSTSVRSWTVWVLIKMVS